MCAKIEVPVKKIFFKIYHLSVKFSNFFAKIIYSNERLSYWSQRVFIKYPRFIIIIIKILIAHSYQFKIASEALKVCKRL